MSTETLTKLDHSKPSTDTVYMARRSELKLVKKPERPIRNAEGDVADMVPGERLMFKDGVLRVPAAPTMKGEKGETLKVDEVIGWLEGHHLLGDRLEGFWKLNEPAPAPSEQEIDSLQELAMELDLKGLEQFIAEEEDGWKRPSLLRSARKSLESATTKVAELQASKAKPSEK